MTGFSRWSVGKSGEGLPALPQKHHLHCKDSKPKTLLGKNKELSNFTVAGTLKGSSPHIPWHRQETQLLPWGRQCRAYATLMNPCRWSEICRCAFITEVYRLEYKSSMEILLFFSILKERQKNRAAPLHSERLGKQFSALDGIHFKPCPSSTTVTTTEKILFK